MSNGAIKYESAGSKANTGTAGLSRSFFSRLSSRSILGAEDRELINATLEARDQWIETNANFDYVKDEMLIDYYIYMIKACEVRYTYFLKLAKQRGLAGYL